MHGDGAFVPTCRAEEAKMASLCKQDVDLTCRLWTLTYFHNYLFKRAVNRWVGLVKLIYLNRNLILSCFPYLFNYFGILTNDALKPKPQRRMTWLFSPTHPSRLCSPHNQRSCKAGTETDEWFRGQPRSRWYSWDSCIVPCNIRSMPCRC